MRKSPRGRPAYRVAISITRQEPKHEPLDRPSVRSSSPPPPPLSPCSSPFLYSFAYCWALARTARLKMMHTRLSRAQVRLLAEAFELNTAEVMFDELAVETWDQPADELVVWLSDRHEWHAEYSVFYLVYLKSLQQ